MWLILFRRCSGVFPAFTCARSIGDFCSICLGSNILNYFPWFGHCKISIFAGVVTSLNDSHILDRVWHLGISGILSIIGANFRESCVNVLSR